MTYQVKEGDVLEYRGDGDTLSMHNFTIGKKYPVKINGLGLHITSDDNEKAYVVVRSYQEFGFHLVPPATIQHEGYNYTRGEPVVPKWVKDGAWIVDKEDGSVVQLFICGNSAGVHGYTETDYGGIDLCDVADVFRPFTNEDWKWGMWAEYKGEKVFVMGAADKDSEFIEVSAKPIDGKNGLFGWSVAHASELTPTTAP